MRVTSRDVGTVTMQELTRACGLRLPYDIRVQIEDPDVSQIVEDEPEGFKARG